MSMGDEERGFSEERLRPKTYMKLAVCSIICGLSCLGIVALINSVKAGESKTPQLRKTYSQRALKFSIMSMAAWALLLICVLLSLGLLSYLLTFIN